MKQIVLLLIIYEVSHIQSNNVLTTNVTSPEKDFFININTNLHNVMNKLFNSLKLITYFSRITKNELLLTMHNHLNYISEKNFEIYDKIKNISFTDTIENRYRNKIIETFKEIITDEKNKKKYNITSDTNEANNDISEKSNDSGENYTEMNESDVNMHAEINQFKNKAKPVENNDLIFRSYNETIKENDTIWRPDLQNQLNRTRRLFHSKSTSIKSYPFVASVHVLYVFVCSGSIISNNLVLTAASCVYASYQKSPKLIFVRVGSDYVKRLGNILQMSDAVFHPGFNSETLRNNLAILRVPGTLHLGYKLRRIEFDREPANFTEDDGVTILGWGENDKNTAANYNFQILASDFLDIYNFKTCKAVYTDRYLTNDNFCAGYKTKGNGACNRDVGGPGIRGGRLVGVISYGSPSCGMHDSPTVFTAVGRYSDWIESVIAEEQSKPKDILRTLYSTTGYPEPLTTTVDYSYIDELDMLEDVIKEVVLANTSLVDYLINNRMPEPKNEQSKAHGYINFEFKYGNDNKESSIEKPPPSTYSKNVYRDDNVDESKPIGRIQKTKVIEPIINLYSNENEDTTPKESAKLVTKHKNKVKGFNNEKIKNGKVTKKKKVKKVVEKKKVAKVSKKKHAKKFKDYDIQLTNWTSSDENNSGMKIEMEDKSTVKTIKSTKGYDEETIAPVKSESDEKSKENSKSVESSSSDTDNSYVSKPIVYVNPNEANKGQFDDHIVETATVDSRKDGAEYNYEPYQPMFDIF